MTVTVRPWDDPEGWNAFVASTPYAHFQQSWQWGELAPQLGGRALRLGAECEGRLVAAAQVFVHDIRGVGRTHLYIPRGPATHEPSIEVLGPLFAAAQAAGKHESAVGLRVEPNAPADNDELAATFRTLGMFPVYPPMQPRSSWLLDIGPSLDDLLTAMKSKTRYNIRLAERKGVTVGAGGPDDIPEFYALLRATAERDGFFVHDESLYRQMFRIFWEAGNFQLLLARYQDELIAAVTLIRFGRTCWYVHGASGNSHRNVMAPYLLQWEAIKWARARGCELYDFRAVPDVLREDQDMYGVYRFKEGFGGYHYTTMHTYAAPYQTFPFGLWHMYLTGRFAIDAYRRRRGGLPARQFS